MVRRHGRRSGSGPLLQAENAGERLDASRSSTRIAAAAAATFLRELCREQLAKCSAKLPADSSPPIASVNTQRTNCPIEFLMPCPE